MNDFKKGDVVKLRDWHTAHGIWKAMTGDSNETVVGLYKRDWERFRLCEPLVLAYGDESLSADSVWLVKSGVVSYYIPVACMYKSRKKYDR